MCAERLPKAQNNTVYTSEGANRQMEKTQGLGNSVSLTTNTHSRIWPVGPLASFFTHIWIQTNIHIQMHKQANTTNAMGTQTPWGWQRFALLPLYSKWCHLCYFKLRAHSCWNTLPHISTTPHPHRGIMKGLLFMNFSAVKDGSLSFLRSYLPHKLGSRCGDWMSKQEK